MPFGVVSEVGLGMDVLDFGGDRRRGRGSLGGGVPLCCVVSTRVYCAKTADWIRMPFGVASEVGLSMGVLDFGGDRRRERGSLGVNLRRPIITDGYFVASLCGSAYSDRAVVWRGEWGGPRHSCVRWKSTCLKGKGLFLVWFVAFFGISACIGFNRSNNAEKCIRLVCENLTVFPYARYTVEFCVAFPFL